MKKELSEYKDAIKSILSVILIVVIFVAFSQIGKAYSSEIRDLISNDYHGILLYVFVMIIETIVAPMSFIPLVGIASNLWGPLVTGFLNWVSWSLGGIIVFVLARKYGRCLFENLISMEKIGRIESAFPKKHIFAGLIFLRIIIPPDILNYALGLFSEVKFKTYFLTTIIGLLPFSFAIAYLGILPVGYQILGFALGIIIIGLGIKISLKNKETKKRKKCKKD